MGGDEVRGPDLPAQDVVRRLRTDIATGALPTGTTVTDGETAARLGADLAVAREAITQLTAEGLIGGRPPQVRRTARVTSTETLALLDVAPVLARAGIERGLPTIDREHLPALRERARSAAERYRAGDIPVAIAELQDLGHALILAGGNRELLAQIDLLAGRMVRTPVPLVDDVVWDIHMRGYLGILDALDLGDTAAALQRHRQMQTEYRARLNAHL